MSRRDHSQIEELMAAAALGGLDLEDERTLERERADHAPCDECGALESSFAEIAGRLAFSLDPAPVDAAMADRILAQGGRVAVIPGAPPATPILSSVAEPGAARGGNRRRRRWAAAAVGIAAVLVVAVVLSLTNVIGVGPMGTHASSAQQFVQFSAPAGGTTEGRLAMVYTPGTPGAVIWGSGLPDPGDGKVYELWTITGSTPTSAGCMEPADGAVAMQLDVNVGGADLMAVTEESSACPAAPTATPFLTAPLSV